MQNGDPDAHPPVACDPEADPMTDEELLDEVKRRGLVGQLLGSCPTCKRWQVYVGVYDRDGKTVRCHGCLRAVAKCHCR